MGPLGGDEGIGEREPVVTGGVELEVECRGEGFEFGGVFVADELGPGVET